MKKVFRLLSLFVVVGSMAALTSCGKGPTIVGKWKCTNATADVVLNDPVWQELYNQYFDASEFVESYKDIVWVFNSNNTVDIEGEGVEDEIGAATYEVKDNKLTITSTFDDPEMETEVLVFDILTLSKDKMVLLMNQDFEFGDETMGSVTINLDFDRL